MCVSKYVTFWKYFSFSLSLSHTHKTHTLIHTHAHTYTYTLTRTWTFDFTKVYTAIPFFPIFWSIFNCKFLSTFSNFLISKSDLISEVNRLNLSTGSRADLAEESSSQVSSASPLSLRFWQTFWVKSLSNLNDPFPFRSQHSAFSSQRKIQLSITTLICYLKLLLYLLRNIT